MDTRFMAKGIKTHDGSMRRDEDPRTLFYKQGEVVESFDIDPVFPMEDFLKSHRNLMERSIACPLTHPIDGDRGIIGSGLYAG
jgi:hypothetical protein